MIDSLRRTWSIRMCKRYGGVEGRVLQIQSLFFSKNRAHKIQRIIHILILIIFLTYAGGESDPGALRIGKWHPYEIAGLPAAHNSPLSGYVVSHNCCPFHSSVHHNIFRFLQQGAKPGLHRFAPYPGLGFAPIFPAPLTAVRLTTLVLRYRPVWLSSTAATSSGVPAATIRPPALPPSGPRSMM